MAILTDDERIGTTIGGRYVVKRVLARGGMGVLFEGEHSWTHRAVAIKVLGAQYASNALAIERFVREARATVTLRHPNVVEVLDMGETDDGVLYMALELLHGSDLQSLLASAGRLSPADAVSVLVPILDALALTHERGFVHRDLKPENI